MTNNPSDNPNPPADKGPGQKSGQSGQSGKSAVPNQPEPDHSMNEEEPLGWDQAPKGSEQGTPHRQPRQFGKGGTPDEQLNLEEAQAEGDPDDPSTRKHRE